MSILMTGATGLIGSHLLQSFLAQHKEVTALTRNPRLHQQRFSDVNWISSLDIFSDLNAFDVVINLAGEPIFNRRWSASYKQRLSQSRWDITAQISQLINASSTPPHTFISSSAMGIYGESNTPLTEQASLSSQFTGRLCQKWEQLALQAHTRVCLLRTGIVLSLTGGALARIKPLYQCGLGGKISHGQQYWSWIHLQDMIQAVLFLMEHPQCQGAFNLTAPHACRQNEFNQELGRILHRPCLLPVPKFAINVVLGERACLLLDSQKGIPQKLLNDGFQFQFSTIQTALQDIFTQ